MSNGFALTNINTPTPGREGDMYFCALVTCCRQVSTDDDSVIQAAQQTMGKSRAG